MKDIKCPLCGKKLKKCQSDTQGICYFCDTCLYNIHGRPGSYWGRGYKTIEETYHAAEAFISKFPPIMRLRQGDFITYLSRYGQRIAYAQIHKIDSYKCVIETSRGTCRPDDVLKWPWELDQTKENHES